MPLQNRVTPLGELVADPARGLVYGNRGGLHDGSGRIRRRYNGKRWIACRLQFRGWHREPRMQPGRFTELFFLDEATALAADRRARLHEGPLDELPDGAFVLWEGTPRLVLGADLLAWAASGYGAPIARPTHQRASVITPSSLVEILRGGWQPVVPLLHPSAFLAGGSYPGQADQRPRPAARASLSARSNVEASLMSGGTGSAFA